jgi:hypothetical protein
MRREQNITKRAAEKPCEGSKTLQKRAVETP